MDVTVAASGVGFTEGPVFRSSGDVVFTSIDGGCLYRIADGRTQVLAVTGGGPNGAAEGADGVIYVAQNGGRWPARASPSVTGGVQIVRPGGLVDWLTQDPVSANDLCFGPDGYLYVTDPTRNGRRDDGRIWRCDPSSGEAELLVSVGWYPNGIGFAREDDAVYVASTTDGTIKRFPITSSGLGRPEKVIELTSGLPDGFAFDAEGNIVIAAVGDGDASGSVQTWTLEAQLLDKSHPSSSRYITNVALNADARLIITDASAGRVLTADWPYAGLPLHPFREVP